MNTTEDRVLANTSDEVNRRIELMTQGSIAYYAAHPEQIDQRLHELAQEWDIERTLEANAATLSLVTVTLGLTVSRKWLLMTGMITGFLLQHAIQGWCPPLPLFRKMGIRTRGEIERERYALKMLRGDFRDVAQGDQANPTRVLEAIHA